MKVDAERAVNKNQQTQKMTRQIDEWGTEQKDIQRTFRPVFINEQDRKREKLCVCVSLSLLLPLLSCCLLIKTGQIVPFPFMQLPSYVLC